MDEAMIDDIYIIMSESIKEVESEL